MRTVAKVELAGRDLGPVPPRPKSELRVSAPSCRVNEEVNRGREDALLAEALGLLQLLLREALLLLLEVLLAHAGDVLAERHLERTDALVEVLGGALRLDDDAETGVGVRDPGRGRNLRAREGKRVRWRRTSSQRGRKMGARCSRVAPWCAAVKAEGFSRLRAPTTLGDRRARAHRREDRDLDYLAEQRQPREQVMVVGRADVVVDARRRVDILGRGDGRARDGDRAGRELERTVMVELGCVNV